MKTYGKIGSLPIYLVVVAPHGTGDILASDGLNHHRLALLHDPD